MSYVNLYVEPQFLQSIISIDLIIKLSYSFLVPYNSVFHLDINLGKVQIVYADRIYTPEEGGLFEQIYVELKNDQVAEFFIYEA